MNKTEFIAAVAAKAELTKKDAEKAVDAVLATITDTLAKGDKVTLIGFGTFEAKDVAAKTTMSFGKKTTTPAHKKPAFKAGKGLKDALNVKKPAKKAAAKKPAAKKSK